LYLRDKVKNTAKANAAKKVTRYGFCAALLCQKTFTTFIDSGSKIDTEDLFSFVQALVALQENLVGDLAKLPLNLKNILIKDIKMAYRLRPLIKDSIRCYPNSLETAINKT
jgi:hypothetical protein